MRTLVHLSDLHFGRVDEALLEPLAAAVEAARPDVVAVSGDLTQRARHAQFRAARAFLDRLPQPQIVVPGNHDVPLYDVLRRFAAPLARFRRYIEPDPAPLFRDEEIAVLGLNTARSLTFKHGRINAAQVALAGEVFAGAPGAATRIVVTHHPFDLPAQAGEPVVGRARMAMRAFADAGVDVLLSGHLHRSHAGDTSARYAIAGYAALVVHAGTASSTRGRGEQNAFNVLRIDGARIGLDTWAWQASQRRFAAIGSREYRRDADGWRAR